MGGVCADLGPFRAPARAAPPPPPPPIPPPFPGEFGLNLLFHLFFVVRYCRSLEEGWYRGLPGDFLYCLLLCGGALLIVSPLVTTHVMFLGSSLTFMMVYLWAKRNPGLQVSFLGLLAFTAPFLPWVLLGFSLFLGHDVTSDLLGIGVGHVYYFVHDVWPALADARGWTVREPLACPRWLAWAAGQAPREAGGERQPVFVNQ